MAGKRIPASNVKKGMILETWFGHVKVKEIQPYTGIYKQYFINVLVFSNGIEMANSKDAYYTKAYREDYKE